jgi:hypothetical protein
MFKHAAEFARGTPYEAKLAQDIKDLAPRLTFKRRFLGVGKSQKVTGSRFGWIIAVVLISSLLRGIFSSSTDSTSPPYTPHVPPSPQQVDSDLSKVLEEIKEADATLPAPVTQPADLTPPSSPPTTFPANP